MKKKFISSYLMFIAILVAACSFAQGRSEKGLSSIALFETSSDVKKEIEKTLKKYVRAGDKNDIKALEKVTHENFRVVLNDTKEMTIKIINRATYLDLVGKKVFGGMPRNIDIQLLDVFGDTNALVKTKLTSDKAIFYNYYSLLKNDDKWWVVQDLLFVEGI